MLTDLDTQRALVWAFANRDFATRYRSSVLGWAWSLIQPLATLVVFAFNAGQSLAVWEGLSTRWFVAAWSNSAVQEASMRSLVIAVCAATIPTAAARERVRRDGIR